MNITITPNEGKILSELSQEIAEKLTAVGLFYRMFERVKSLDSVNKKLSEKEVEYSEKGKRMQDLLGIRITVYFADDQNIVMNILKSIYTELPENHNIDQLNDERFGIIRFNLIFQLPEQYLTKSRIFDHPLIDSTFEVQLRTVFSEGWHEIEHDLRYKCKPDWLTEEVLSRQLNSQSAVLESCDWTILKILDEFSYNKYKSRDWSSFFRNIIRIRFTDSSLSDQILDFLNTNTNVAKELLKIKREDLFNSISKITHNIPLKMDNVFFILNRYVLKEEAITALEPELLRKVLSENLASAATLLPASAGVPPVLHT